MVLQLVAYLYLESFGDSLHVWEVWEVQGIHTPQYFVADKGQLLYKFPEPAADTKYV